MLNKLPASLKTPLKFTLIIGSIVYFTLVALYSFGSLGDTFIAVLANLIVTTLTLAALASIPLFLLIKKEKVAKIMFTLLSGLYIVNFSREFLLGANIFDVNGDALINTFVIFRFIFGLGLVGALILIILSYILKKKRFLDIVFYIFLGNILIAYTCGILYLVIVGRDAIAWTMVVQTIAFYFIHPILIPTGCAYFHLANKEDAE